MWFKQNSHVEFSLSKISRNCHVCLSMYMCTHVCWCLPLLLSTSKSKVVSVSHRAGALNFNWLPGQQTPESTSSASTGVAEAHCHTQIFTCMKGIQAQDLMLTLQSLYPLNHLFSFFPAFLNIHVNHFNGELASQ